MVSTEQDEIRRWAVAQIESLEVPGEWQPDSERALARLHARMESARPTVGRFWPVWATAAILAGVVLLSLPVGRVAAQQLWQFLTVRKVAFIRVNRWPVGVPSPQVNLIGTPIPPLPAHDLDEARWRVHYDPRLPRPGVFSASPRLSTTFSLSAGTVIHTADLELALRQSGITGQTVPPEWNGARIALHTSAVVLAEWPDVVFAQSLPLTLATPPDFDFSAFSALILRVLGAAPDEARRLAERMGTTPTWLAPIGQDIGVGATMEEITLNSGPATLLQEFASDGTVKRITVIWNVPDRVYLLSGQLNRELALAAANAVE